MKSVSSVCSREVTTCFTSASVTNRLPARYLWSGPNMYKSIRMTLGLYGRLSNNLQAAAGGVGRGVRDIHLCWSRKKQENDSWFAVDAEVKQAVTSWTQTLDKKLLLRRDWNLGDTESVVTRCRFEIYLCHTCRQSCQNTALGTGVCYLVLLIILLAQNSLYYAAVTAYTYVLPFKYEAQTALCKDPVRTAQ